MAKLPVLLKIELVYMYSNVLWHCCNVRLVSVVSSFLASPITRLSVFLLLWASSSCQILCIPLDVRNGEIKEPCGRKALSAVDEWIIVVSSLRAQLGPYVPADQICRKSFSEGQLVLPPQGHTWRGGRYLGDIWKLMNAAQSETHDGPFRFTSILFHSDSFQVLFICAQVLLCIFHCKTWNCFASSKE